MGGAAAGSRVGDYHGEEAPPVASPAPAPAPATSARPTSSPAAAGGAGGAAGGQSPMSKLEALKAEARRKREEENVAGVQICKIEDPLVLRPGSQCIQFRKQRPRSTCATKLRRRRGAAGEETMGRRNL